VILFRQSIHSSTPSETKHNYNNGNNTSVKMFTYKRSQNLANMLVKSDVVRDDKKSMHVPLVEIAYYVLLYYHIKIAHVPLQKKYAISNPE